ncbi:hypothetical protein TNCV_848731 [Trichonephila clavipes]|uniref:Uncharacterized protein n=1 Tax=Trichonephila clavipes TaxID=2585209 RepID=A0A8X6V5J3_TRICX|nr:hypothetical protein TNCV_848731 [Trichonephila clavipes]
MIHERLVHAPLPKPVEYLSFCVRGKLSQMVVKETKKFPRALETLPEFNDDGTFPNSLHEDVSGIINGLINRKIYYCIRGFKGDV